MSPRSPLHTRLLALGISRLYTTTTLIRISIVVARACAIVGIVFACRWGRQISARPARATTAAAVVSRAVSVAGAARARAAAAAAAVRATAVAVAAPLLISPTGGLERPIDPGLVAHVLLCRGRN